MISRSSSGPEFAAYLEELTQLRVDAGLTVAELAQQLGVEEGAIRAGEAGSRTVDVAELQVWALECGSTLEAFIKRLDARLRRDQQPGLLRPNDDGDGAAESGAGQLH